MTTEQAPPAEQQPAPAPLGSPGQPAVPAAQHGMDPRMAQMSIRYTTSPVEKQWNDERANLSWGHARPFSCYVAAMGNHWQPGSWAKVSDMVHFANANGMFIQLDEIQDRCTKPYDALGTMRNEAILRAAQGFEFLCYVDNDVLPAEDVLFRLLRHMFEEQRSIMAPYVAEPGTGRPLHGPVANKYQGTKPVRWSVLSFLVFRTSVFNAFPGKMFWGDAIGADEGYHFQKLYDVGHSPFISTELVVPVYKPPTYPLTLEKQPNADAMWKSKRDELDRVPNRSPEDPRDPRVNEQGVYMPFLNVVCNAQAGGCGQPKPGDWWKRSPICGECQQKQGQAAAASPEALAAVTGQPAAPVDPQVTNMAAPPPAPVIPPPVSPNAPTPVGGKPPAPQEGEDGYYTQCKAFESGGVQCTQQTPLGNGFCHLHQDRATPKQ